MPRYYVGVDEVGRGPLAGPLVVVAVLVHSDSRPSFLEGIADSKKLSEKKRELWFSTLSKIRNENKLYWQMSLSTPKSIDENGMSHALSSCVNSAITRLPCNPQDTEVLLDGGLHAPDHFIGQKTIIKGDEKEPLIAAASVIAKVLRDRRMKKYSEKFPKYGFETHKGYGTQMHRDAIAKYGMCPIHRRSFIH